MRVNDILNRVNNFNCGFERREDEEHRKGYACARRNYSGAEITIERMLRKSETMELMGTPINAGLFFSSLSSEKPPRITCIEKRVPALKADVNSVIVDIISSFLRFSELLETRLSLLIVQIY